MKKELKGKGKRKEHMLVKMWTLESLLTIGETVKWCSCDENTIGQFLRKLKV